MRSAQQQQQGAPAARPVAVPARASAQAVLPTARQPACSCGGACPRCRPSAGTLEQAADHMAATAPAAERRGPLLPLQAPTGAAWPAAVAATLAAPGRPLGPASLRAGFERQFGWDFAAVRVHDDALAARSAQGQGALAYAAGTHLVFAAGQHRPGTAPGRQLIAHELAHVVQQQHLGARLQRQVAGSTTFSVVQADYEALLVQALATMGSGRLVANTLAGQVLPMLQAMAASPTWRDAGGADHGGAAVTQPVPGAAGGTSVTLRLVLDDDAAPLPAGLFQPRGDSGTLIVKLRRAATADALTEVLYHESLHLLSWLIGSHGARLASPDRHAALALDLSRFATQIAALRRQLGELARGVNLARHEAGRPAVTDAELDRIARWLMDEVQVRAEAEVFQQQLQVERQRERGGLGAMYIPTRAYGDITATMVRDYVFRLNSVFDERDLAAIGGAEEAVLRTLQEMMEGFFQLHVRRRFSLTAATTGSSIARPRIDIGPMPLEPPDMRRRLLDSVDELP